MERHARYPWPGGAPGVAQHSPLRHHQPHKATSRTSPVAIKAMCLCSNAVSRQASHVSLPKLATPPKHLIERHSGSHRSPGASPPSPDIQQGHLESSRFPPFPRLLTGIRSAPRKLMAAGCTLGSLEHLAALSRLLSLLVQGPLPRSSALSWFCSSPS